MTKQLMLLLALTGLVFGTVACDSAETVPAPVEPAGASAPGTTTPTTVVDPTGSQPATTVADDISELQTPPAPGMGNVEFVVVPPHGGGTVKLDGVDLGEAPVALAHAVGTCKVEVDTHLRLQAPASQEFEIKPGDNRVEIETFNDLVGIQAFYDLPPCLIENGRCVGDATYNLETVFRDPTQDAYCADTWGRVTGLPNIPEVADFPGFVCVTPQAHSLNDEVTLWIDGKLAIEGIVTDSGLVKIMVVGSDVSYRFRSPN